jgi:hypothetical protein
MSGAWPQTPRRRESALSGRALQAVPPATGTIIGHLTGRVIWDSSNFLAANSRDPAIPHLAPGLSDHGFHQLLGLGLGTS